MPKVLLFLLAAVLIPVNADELLMPDAEQSVWIADRIYANECNRNPACLTSWNAGEDFPSLGIGHFIWYRSGQDAGFRESFPALIAFYREQGVAVPAWLDALPDLGQPWASREAFLLDQDGPLLAELRTFLLQTTAIQAAFIVQRLYDSAPEIVAAGDDPQAVSDLFARIAGAAPPHGMYALIDYVNFKGEGTHPGERYQGQGWGLLQVLETMLSEPLAASDDALMRQFADAASQVLQQRVDNSPPERTEQRWMAGWHNRTRTYIP